MADTEPLFNQRDISDENGPVDTTVDGLSKTRLLVDSETKFDPFLLRKTTQLSEPLKESGGSKLMNVDGSVTPVVFEIGPPAGDVWFIYALNFAFQDSGTADIRDFGSIDGGLSNGLLIESILDSTAREMANLHDNFEIAEHFSFAHLIGVANGWMNSSNFFIGKWDFSNGEKMKLVGDDGDKIRATVRDDLTGINDLEMSFEAYVVI